MLLAEFASTVMLSVTCTSAPPRISALTVFWLQFSASAAFTATLPAIPPEMAPVMIRFDASASTATEAARMVPPLM